MMVYDNQYYTNGQYFDELYFEMTAAEWDQLDPPVALANYRAGDEEEFNLKAPIKRAAGQPDRN